MTAVASYTFSTTFHVEPHNICLAPACNSTMSLRYSPKIAQPPLVYRLPVETLARIFEIGTHGTEDPNDATEFPMLVSAVSRHFRSVAIETPNLWTTIRFDSQRPFWYDPNLDDEYDYTYPRDLLWINRSKACPLNLILSFRDGSWNFNEHKHYFRREHMETILSLLSPHASRIQRFTLVCDTFAPLHASLLFLAEHGAVMENLQTLELYRCNEFPAEHPSFYPGDLADPIPLLGGCCAPKLSNVILSGVHTDWARSLVALSNLRTLELSFHSRDVRPSVFEFTQILHASPNLTSLTMKASGPSIPSTGAHNQTCVSIRGAGTSRVYLPHLKNLAIGYQDGADTEALLHLVDTPSVIDLTIADTSRPSESDTNGGSYALESLATPTRKYFPGLEVLCLHTVKATARAFTSFFDSHPRLHTLKLIDVSNEVLSVISSTSPSLPDNLPCPALRELSLQFMSGINVGSVARARAAAGMPLEELSIHVLDKISEEELSLAKRYSESVKFFGNEYEDGEEDMMDWGENEDPYALGGAFNDPEFDSMFT